MPQNPKTVTATAYLQVEPEWSGYMPDRDDPSDVRGAKVVTATQKRSPKPRPGTVEVKVTIEIPRAAFVALHPEATIVIPESFTIPHPVVVEAVNPNEES